MSKKKTDDQRSPDQDTAVEQAFVAGTLPEEDRRDAKGDLPIDPPKPSRPSQPPVMDNSLPEGPSADAVAAAAKQIFDAQQAQIAALQAENAALATQLAAPDFVPVDHEGLPL